ncbi:FAD-binding oxidoreductase [bacterium M00.F.Ca.ET.230.01.1.1]|nr:FAD-binding oxidoreductase [bacterium M00.F.Ca.ET.230.01.1.1]
MPRKLDLRSGTPVWSVYRSPSVPVERLTRDVKADILIVGMGISGAMMAKALTRDGHSVVCIDRRGPLKGSTAATTALVQFEIDQPLTRLSRIIGADAAQQAWRRSRLALFNLRWRAAAILSHDNLALDPRKLTSGLLHAALKRKARFYAPAEATAIEANRQSVTVATRNGPTIMAKHLLLATGYELLDAVPAVSHRVISTWAIATRPQPHKIWPRAAMIWEASNPYLYMRATADARVICGGEDEDFIDEERRWRKRPGPWRSVFPHTEAHFAWSGSFGATSTGLPTIGSVPGHARIHAVMGYGGNGITYSQIASEIVSAAMTGAKDADAELFSFKA